MPRAVCIASRRACPVALLHKPHSRRVLTYPHNIQPQEACFKEVVVLFRRKVGKGRGGGGHIVREIVREASWGKDVDGLF